MEIFTTNFLEICFGLDSIQRLIATNVALQFIEALNLIENYNWVVGCFAEKLILFSKYLIQVYH